MIIISVFVNGLLIAGVLLANIYLIILAIAILILITPIIYKKRDDIEEMFKGDSDTFIEDERTQFINEKAACMTLGILIAVVSYAAIIIVALRDKYPQFLDIGYTLFVIAALCFVLYFISRAYYSRKY
ncbi:MAG: DUF2178 domain-containing protein [Methanobacterium sp.]